MSSSKLNLVVNFQGQDGLSGTLKNIVGLGKSGGAALRGLGQDARSLNRDLKSTRTELAGATGNVTALVAKERELEDALAGVNKQIDRQKRLNLIEADRLKMLQRGEDLQQRGKDNMKAGATLAAPFILATKSAADFSSGMVDIQQKTDLTTAQTGRLTDNILAMSAAAKAMPEDVRAGLDVFLAKGMDLSAAQNALGPTARLATALKVDMTDGANAAYSSINNLKIASSQTGAIFDVMAKAGNEGSFEVRDMARHFPALTAQMQALGQKGLPAVADLSAGLQVMMNTAGSADEAGNNMANLLAKINAPSTISAFKKNFGVDLPAAMAKLEAQGYSSLESIAMVTQEATKGDMKKLGFAFEDQQARMGILGLIQNMEEYRRIRGEAMNGDGTVDKAFAQRAAGDATVNWRAFMGTASQLAIVLGTTLLPVMTETMSMLVGAGQSVAAWAQANPEAAGFMVKLVAGFAAMRIGIGALQFAFGGLLGPAANVFAFFRKADGISKFGTLMARVGPMAGKAFTLIRTGAMFMARGIMQAGMMMLANPVVLAIVALVAVIGLAGYMIYKHWDTIKAAFYSGVAALGQAMAAGKAWVVNGWNAVKTGFMAGLNFIIGLHSKMLNIGKNIILGLARGITSAASAVWNALKSVVMSGINKVKDLLGIASPSRLFMQFGGWMGEGLAIGIDRSAKLPQKSMANLAGMMAGMGGEMMAPGGDTARFDPRRRVVGAMAAGAMALTPMAPASGAARAQMPSGATFYVTIKIDGAENKDARELAREIKRELEALDESDARSSFEDQE